MADPERAAELLQDYGLEDVDAVSDPNREIYQTWTKARKL